MPRKKEVKEEKVDKSDAYIAFEQHLEAYKAQNPIKFEAKKEELLAKLKSL